jgi:hypothetical protein
MAQKRRKPGKDKGPTPLDEKARALAEAQAKLEMEIANKQKFIQEAPERAKEIERRRREELINRASRTEARPGSRVALHDPRFGYELNPGLPARQKALRSERRKGRLLFFVLLFVLGIVAFWAYYTFTQP